MGLLDKMYEDGKYAAKERNKQNEINKKRAENEARQKEAEAYAEADKNYDYSAVTTNIDSNNSLIKTPNFFCSFIKEKISFL